jgi:hypothetical protein
MAVVRYLTLFWPGLPWAWLRGSVMGLVLAVAFAVTLDMAVLATWIWSELLGLPLQIVFWAAAAAIWLAATVSACSSFPPSLQLGRDPATDALFVKARDAYLARDWLGAETRLRALLDVAPTDGEAQLLLGTLLRRVGRLDEARDALEKLSRSDTGRPWQVAIRDGLSRLQPRTADAVDSGESSEPPATLPIPAESDRPAGRSAAA